MYFRYAASSEKKLEWAVRMFEAWRTARNDAAMTCSNMSTIAPDIELVDFTADQLNFALSRFVIETKKQNGEDYPGKTLREIILCVQMYLEKRGIVHRFFTDPQFKELTNTVDNIMKLRAQQGIGTSVKQAQEITLDEEEMLWTKGVLGSDNPKTLRQTVFYLLGVHFALRGGKEHRNLRAGDTSQFSLHVDSEGTEYLQYCEDATKNNQGGLKHARVGHKVVRAYAITNKNRCVVNLYKRYLSLCPVPRPVPFYLKELKNYTSDCWYGKQQLGVHPLEKVVSEIARDGGIPGYRTNHSLRVTAASRLYQADVDEQLIKEVTGHRSDAVRNYKRTTEPMKRKLSAILAGEQAPPTLKTVAQPTVIQPTFSVTQPTSSAIQPTASRDNPTGKTITFNMNIHF